MHVENRIDVLKLCLRTCSGRNFVGMDSKVNLISNVIQLNIHPKENGINILSIWIVHSTIPNRSPLSISRAYHRDLIYVQNMTETSLSLIWGVTAVVALILSVSNIFQIHWKHFSFFCTTDGFGFLQRYYSAVSPHYVFSHLEEPLKYVYGGIHSLALMR